MYGAQHMDFTEVHLVIGYVFNEHEPDVAGGYQILGLFMSKENAEGELDFIRKSSLQEDGTFLYDDGENKFHYVAIELMERSIDDA